MNPHLLRKLGRSFMTASRVMSGKSDSGVKENFAPDNRTRDTMPIRVHGRLIKLGQYADSEFFHQYAQARIHYGDSSVEVVMLF